MADKRIKLTFNIQPMQHAAAHFQLKLNDLAFEIDTEGKNKADIEVEKILTKMKSV